MKVIIVGAGVAGIAAADYLCRNGVDDVTILEARNRPGGRLYLKENFRFGGKVRYGAHWFHSRDNSAYKFSKELNLLGTDEETSESEYGAGVISQMRVFTSNGREISKEVVKKASEIFSEALIFISNYFDGLYSGRDGVSEKLPFKSLDDFFTHSIERQLESDGCSDLDGKADNEDLRLALSTCKMIYGNYSGEELCNVGAHAYLINEVPSHQDVVIPETFLDKLLEQVLNKVEIMYGREVDRIEWSHDGGQCRIHCHVKGKNYVEEEESYEADNIICTLPIGVIQAKMDHMFSPGLPEEKRKAISHILPGAIGKYFFIWKQDWTELINGFKSGGEDIQIVFAASEEELKGKKDDWTMGIVVMGFPVVSNKELTLLCFIVGRFAKMADKLKDEEVIQGLGQKLRQYVSNAIPNPDSLMRVCWTSDEYSLGVYSVPSLEAEKTDFETVGQPLPNATNPKLLFAGEATSAKDWSYIHGAFESGIREAKRLVFESKSTQSH